MSIFNKLVVLTDKVYGELKNSMLFFSTIKPLKSNEEKVFLPAIIIKTSANYSTE